MLQLQGVSAAYGAVRALDGVDLTVGDGEIVTLVGANGAGKTTLLMTICGRPRAASGRVLLKGQDTPACRPTASPRSASPMRRRGGGSLPG